MWKSIEGFTGYEISDTGLVRNIKTGSYIKPHMNRTGYWRLRLSQKNLLLHRLLMIAFVPNPECLPYVNHKNGIKTENSLENLEWCTGKHNRIHAVKSGLITNTTKGIRSHSKLDEIQVRTIRRCLEDGMQCKFLAPYFKVSPTLISAIKRRVAWANLS